MSAALTDDWDSIPVAGGKQAATSGGGITSDWDSVPVKAAAQPASPEKIGAAKSAVSGAVAKQVLLNHPAVGALEAGANMLTGMIAKPLSDIGGLAAAGYEMATGGNNPDGPTGFKKYIQDSLTYDPRGTTGKVIAEQNPIALIGKGYGLIGQEAGDAIKGDGTSPTRQAIGNGVADLIPQAAGILSAKAGSMLKAKGNIPVSDILKPTDTPVIQPRIEPTLAKPRYKLVDGKPVAVDATGKAIASEAISATPADPAINVNAEPNQSGLQSVGAAATSYAKQAAAAGAAPDVVAAIQKAESSGNLQSGTAAARHIEASSLPVPIDLTAGQATGDINMLSHEQNIRGSQPELAQRFNQQNGKLVDNINAIRDTAAPDVYAVNHVENGQALIDSYKAKDAAVTADISAKYKALEDANGGNFPVDGKAFVDAADAALTKKMKGRYVPPEIQADMDTLRSGGAMTYENFENMRTNLAAEARKAERAGDGNRAMATSIVRDALENVPISGATADLKPLADAARSAAKARFDMMKNDPAYKAAVNDTTAPDDFISKHVINGKAGDVKTMRQNLADDPLAGQTIAAGTINFLKNRAGINGDSGNFSQAGYNKALQAVKPKINDLFDPDQANQLQTLGNVARYTQEQPRGSYVNNSNTLVGSIANNTKELALGALNIKTLGAANFVRGKLAERATAKSVQKSLEPAAGITSVKDFPK